MYTNSESKVYILGTNNGYSNMEILNAFTDLVGKVDVLLKPHREGDPDTLIAKLNTIKEMEMLKSDLHLFDKEITRIETLLEENDDINKDI